MPPRLYQFPSFSYTARASLDPNLQPTVDVALKDLKSTHQRLQAACSEFSNELQILGRLYYKGYNQHRLALFWKRTAEVRNYGRRIDDASVCAIVDALRRSFFGPDARENPKLLRGSWSHLPDSNSLSSSLKRLAQCQHLFSKARERFSAAYLHFALAMQSGAFIQLLVVLAAVVSRMHILIDEIQTASQLALTAGRSVFEAFYVSPRSLPTSGIVPTDGTATTHRSAPGDLTDEDIGEVLEATPSSWRTIQSNPPLTEKTPGLTAAFRVPVVTRKVVNVASSTNIEPKIKAAQKRRKQEKLDEIDDIFGSL